MGVEKVSWKVLIMDFGRISDISNVDFSLPVSDHFFFRRQKGDGIQVLLGAPGWSVPKWKGLYYPKRCQSSEFATFYSRQFATVEFNTTFYQIPKPDMIARWCDMTEPDFVFCPKMFADISQSGSLAMGNAVLPDFLERMTLFDAKLGMLYMQLPKSFSIAKEEALIKFASNWQMGMPLSIELRNETWFQPGNGDYLAECMAEAGISWMITDVAGRRDVSHSYITAPFMGIRFVGTVDSIDFARIDAWIERLLIWQDAGVEVVYVFVHTPGTDLPHSLCEYFARQWEKRTGNKLKYPQPLQID